MAEPYEQLEAAWAAYNGTAPEQMVVCASGTAALHLALEALRLPAEAQILIPDLTMIACPRAAVLAGLQPVFVDCGNDLLMDVGEVAPAATPRTKAIMPVSLYGRQCWKSPWVIETAKDRQWAVVEDLAEAHGIKPHPQSGAACWSFYKNKIVAGEEGGAVWFRDSENARVARELRCLGFTRKHDFYHRPHGCNYRLANSLATLVLKSLADVEVNQQARREIESWYDEELLRHWQNEGLVRRMPPRDAVWVYDLRVPGLTYPVQDLLIETLREYGVAARHCFKPCRAQLEFRPPVKPSPNKRRTMWDTPPAPKVWNSEVCSREVFYLPVQPGITTRADVRKAFEIISTVLEKAQLEDSSGAPDE